VFERTFDRDAALTGEVCFAHPVSSSVGLRTVGLVR
jgi:hypothetical protein